MAEKRVQRRLAVIVAADVAGYTKIIEKDELATRARFNDHLDSVIAGATRWRTIADFFQNVDDRDRLLFILELCFCKERIGVNVTLNGGAILVHLIRTSLRHREKRERQYKDC
jgi:hypothetical protein